MRTLLLLAIALVLSLRTGTAAADPERVPLGFHATIGVELMGGGQVLSTSTRGAASIDVPLLRGHLQPTIGAGATVALGSLSVEDPRALSGSLSLGYFEYGPEMRLGLRFVNGGVIDKQLFASLAYLRTTLDDRLMLDAVDGVGGTRGMRASVGFNYADKMIEWALPENGERDTAMNLLLLLAPQQVEVTWERSCGSDRTGVTLSWGI